MNKENQEWIIDADVVIDLYNKKNPTLRKMTQGSLADECDVSAQRLSDWKRGQTVKAIQVIKKMSELADCPMEDFIHPFVNPLRESSIDDGVQSLARDENARIKNHGK